MDFPKSVPSVGLVDGKFIDEDAVAGTPGSLIPSAWGNAVTLEILKVIEDGGLIPAEDNNAQLSAAIKALVSDGAVSFATQPEAEAGTNTTKAMSPLRVFQAIAKVVQQATESAFGWLKIATSLQVTTGTDNSTAVTPQKLAAAAQMLPFNTVTSGGSGTLYTISPAPGAAAPSFGQRFTVSFHAASGATPTIVVSGRAAKNLKQYDSAGVKVPAIIAAGLVSDIVYDGTDFVLMTPLPSTGSATEAVAGVLRLSTQSQTDAGTDGATAVTPLKLRFGFQSSFAANGYIKFPSWLLGIVFQWGSMTSSATAASFPLVFPNACLFLGGTPNQDSNSGGASTEFMTIGYVLSASQFRMRTGTTNGVPVRWFAVGY